MKKTFVLLFSLLLFVVTTSSAQMTEWSRITINGKFGGYMAFERDTSNNLYIHLKYVITPPNGHFSHREGDKISFDFTNGKYVTLESKSFALTCLGCGSIGLGYSQALGMYRVLDITAEEYELFKTGTLNFFNFQYWQLDDRQHKFSQFLKPKVSEKLKETLLW